MAKIKLRYRNEILEALAKASGPISLRVILRSIGSEDAGRNPSFERSVAKELRFLIKLKEVEKGQGSLYRIRPPKTARAKIRRERDHKFEEKEQREARRSLNRSVFENEPDSDLSARQSEDRGGRCHRPWYPCAAPSPPPTGVRPALPAPPIAGGARSPRAVRPRHGRNGACPCARPRRQSCGYQ